ncbi:hypothetical protein QTO30_04240 [Yoonia sp. GPGPB17]|uniref:hypothetical protein n=1 Tax=Yoonia sp. GPGPB17 TaxID=3026147 RepID=UPI0030BACC98
MDNIVRKSARHLGLSPSPTPPEATLIIGDLARWSAEGRKLMAADNFQFSDLKSLSAPFFADIAPTIVLSPLFGDDFDVIDVATRLDELGYRGQYRAITENLPDDDMIRKEVRAHAPELDFDLLMMQRVANDG